MKMDAVALYLIFVAGEKNLSRLICRVDGGPYSHMAIGYRLRNGDEIYYEALVGRGFIGPRPLTDLIEWQAENPERKVIVLEVLPLADLAETKRIETVQFANSVTYSELQLAALLFVIKFGWDLRDSPHRVICSEIVARILSTDLDLRDETRRTFDVVSPGSAWRRLIVLTQQYLTATGKHLVSIRYVGGQLPENRPGGPVRGDLFSGLSTPAETGDLKDAVCFCANAVWFRNGTLIRRTV